MKTWNRRQRALGLLLLTAVILLAVTVSGALLTDRATAADFSRTNLAPGPDGLFGTDWLGRDMLARTLTGLSMSIRIGLCTAGISACIALALGIMSAVLGSRVDAVISFLIDTIMGIPHILLLILVSFAFGKGFKGVVLGVALTHWPSLARVIRSEVMQLKDSEYIQAAARLGQGKLTIAVRHMLPHLFPQFAVGLILMFPHAILHEASITFLGFGLTSEQPAIGVVGIALEHVAVRAEHREHPPLGVIGELEAVAAVRFWVVLVGADQPHHLAVAVINLSLIHI